MDLCSITRYVDDAGLMAQVCVPCGQSIIDNTYRDVPFEIPKEKERKEEEKELEKERKEEKKKKPVFNQSHI